MALTIAVTVKPNAKQIGVKKLADAEYRVSVTAPPEGGKANQAVLELLADHFGVAKSAIKILRGHRTRRKLIRVD
jgi:uncharacterized protein (TIGR00251 family)